MSYFILAPYTLGQNNNVSANCKYNTNVLVYTGRHNLFMPYTGPYGSPTSVVVMTTGTTTANITWAPPDPNLQNGVIIYYTLILTDLMFGMPERVHNTTSTSFSFTGLEEYTRYGCKVAAATIGGLGPFSTPVRFTTFEDSKNVIAHYRT